MEPQIKAVFEEAGRIDLLEDKTLRYALSDEDKATLESATGRGCDSDATSFKLAAHNARPSRGWDSAWAYQ